MILRLSTIPVLCVLVLILAEVGHCQKGKPLDAFFDPSKNETIVYLSQRYMPVATYASERFIPPSGGAWISKPEGLRMVVLFKCVGKEPSVPDAVIVRFKSTASRKYRYDQDRSFTVTADSKKFDLGQLELTNSERDTSSRGIGGFYYEETLEKVIKLEDYARIVAAKKVEIIVGETNFRLSQKDINSLRSYLERLKS